MKIMVLSDSHGKIDLMADVVLKHAGDSAGDSVGNTAKGIEHVFFLGDYISDCTKLIERLKPHKLKLSYHMVPGNCDYYSSEPLELLLDFKGKKFWLLHGHKYDVKHDYSSLIHAAISKGADVCLFGHSHVPLQFEKNGILFLNPGSISQPRGTLGKSYAILEILDNAVLANIIEA